MSIKTANAAAKPWETNSNNKTNREGRTAPKRNLLKKDTTDFPQRYGVCHEQEIDIRPPF